MKRPSNTQTDWRVNGEVGYGKVTRVAQRSNVGLIESSVKEAIATHCAAHAASATKQEEVEQDYVSQRSLLSTLHSQ